MRIIKKILIILAIVLLLISAIGLIFFPSQIHVERKVTINQKQHIVFNYVGNLENWNKWTIWSKRDPAAKYTIEGHATGEGALLRWNSENRDVGKGSITITEFKPDSFIMQELKLMENGSAKSSFRLSSNGNSTNITWSLDMEAGANPLMRIMGSFMDGIIGKDFEGGLMNLKNNTETLAEPDSMMVH